MQSFLGIEDTLPQSRTSDPTLFAVIYYIERRHKIKTYIFPYYYHKNQQIPFPSEWSDHAVSNEEVVSTVF